MQVKIIKHGTVLQSENVFGGFDWPSLARLADGRLFVVCSGFRLGHICPFGKVVGCYSKDDGETWSAPVIVLDTPLDDRDGGVVVDGKRVMVTSFNNSRKFQRETNDLKEERLLALKNAYVACVSDEEERKYVGSTYVVSEDGGDSFGEVQKAPVTSPHGPLVMPDGSLYYLGRACNVKDGEFVYENAVAYAVSKDWKTWSEPIRLPVEAREGYTLCEPYAVRLKSGRIVAGIRLNRNDSWDIYNMVSYSDDNGKTYAEWKTFDTEGAPPHLFQHSCGAVILSYGYRKPKYGQRARISWDDGETWSEEIILRDDAPRGDLGYPATIECKDGSLLTVYYTYAEGKRHAGIYYTKWELPKRQ